MHICIVGKGVEEIRYNLEGEFEGVFATIKGALTGFAPVLRAFLCLTAGFLGTSFAPVLPAF
jgi:hypothetical protein